MLSREEQLGCDLLFGDKAFTDIFLVYAETYGKFRAKMSCIKHGVAQSRFR